MLAMRLQRTGRKGHAQYRVVVQDARRTPTSGRVVASLGNYNPHTKELTLAKDKAEFYLQHGAQPSDRVARLLQAQGVKLPNWVKLAENKERTIRNAEKLRKNRPAGAEAPTPAAQEADEATTTTEEVVEAEEAPKADDQAKTEPAATEEVTGTATPEAEAEVAESATEEPAADTTPEEAEASPEAAAVDAESTDGADETDDKAKKSS